LSFAAIAVQKSRRRSNFAHTAAKEMPPSASWRQKKTVGLGRICVRFWSILFFPSCYCSSQLLLRKHLKRWSSGVWGLPLVDLIFAAFQPQVYKLFNVLKIRLLPLIGIISICIVSGFAVSYCMEWLNIVLSDEVTLYLPIYLHLDHPLIYAIIFTAAFPAIFEEIAFRGFVYDNFKAIGGVRSAIWGSSFLFALVHFSLLSLVWIMPFGLLLAYFRTKYSSLLYGMVGHFVHNTTVVLIEYYMYFDVQV
jgi:membrane protease YdiL (CAAX protease family)